VEMRADRREAAGDRREAAKDRRQAAEDRRRSDERFDRVIAEFRQDSLRRDAATQKILERTEKTYKDIRTVGFAIVKTLNRHTRLLERIDRKLGIRNNGGPGQGNGRRI
jgi:hypothetical protein